MWCAGFPWVVPLGGRGGAEPAWCGIIAVLVGCGVSCPSVGEGGAVWYGGGGLRGGLPGGGGATVSRSGGLGGRSWLVLGRCAAAPCGLPVVPLVCFSTWAVRGRCGVGLVFPWGGVRGIGVSQPRGCLRGAWGCRPTGEWAQWCRKRCLWATRELPCLWGPRVGGSRHLGRVVVPVRPLWVVSGGVWLGCIVYTVEGGLCALVSAGSVVGYRLVAGAGASLWEGLPRCHLGASRCGPWPAG